MEVDDEQRYKESLQRSLLTDGWDSYFDIDLLKSWVDDNRERLRSAARETLGEFAEGQEDCFAELVDNFEPSGRFELPNTQAIFRPLFDEILESAGEIGFRPIRTVELITSTSVAPTPFARPTSDSHQLFVGQGTSSFCNYWSKVYTAIVKRIVAINGPNQRITSIDLIRNSFRQDPQGILLAARLSLYYAWTGTVLGFGEVRQPPSYAAYKVELLKAMEVFAISHEYAHFYFHEKNGHIVDANGNVSELELEFACDLVGLQISRHWGTRNENWLAYTGIGAIAFFTAVETSESCRHLLSKHSNWQMNSRSEHVPNSHPDPSERARRLVTFAIDKTHEDEKIAVKDFLEEYRLICSTISTDIPELLAEALDLGPITEA